ncbi:MAG: hypothetical protein Q4A24_03005 [Akkermansia sp.]|nr:hypothetical protein [Akkermansia sp.]
MNKKIMIFVGVFASSCLVSCTFDLLEAIADPAKGIASARDALNSGWGRDDDGSVPRALKNKVISFHGVLTGHGKRNASIMDSFYMTNQYFRQCGGIKYASSASSPVGRTGNRYYDAQFAERAAINKYTQGGSYDLCNHTYSKINSKEAMLRSVSYGRYALLDYTQGRNLQVESMETYYLHYSTSSSGSYTYELVENGKTVAHGKGNFSIAPFRPF